MLVTIFRLRRILSSRFRRPGLRTGLRSSSRMLPRKFNFSFC